MMKRALLILAVFGLLFETAHGQFSFREAMMGAAKRRNSGIIYITNGLVGYWPLDSDKISGTNSLDLSSSGANAAPYTSPIVYSNGVINTSSTNTFFIASQASLVMSTGLTVCAWVNGAAQINKGIAGKYYTVPGSRSWAIYSENGGTGSKFGFAAQSSGAVFSTAQTAVSTATAFDSTWHHVVGVFSASTRLEVWVDGVLSGTGTPGASMATNAVAVEIGQYNFTTGNIFEGKIDEVLLYNRPLSSNEIWTTFSAR
jgi:hypothetical protein